jgi:hypothetical protein
MAVITSLHLYPVKSCAGLALTEAVLGARGLETQGVGDREWMVVHADDGQFLTQRRTPRLALVRPVLEADALRLTAPGQAELRLPLAAKTAPPGLQVKVWNHECLAHDEGEAAAAWFSAFLGIPVRLVRFDPAHRRASSADWTGGVEALNRFSDGYPMLLISQASLDDLNDRLAEAGREKLPMNRFRPNVVIAEVGPYEEDYLESLTAGEMVLKPVKPCPRCPMPSIEQATGEFGPDPLDILSQYRNDERTGGVIFGQNVIAQAGAGAILKVGMEMTPEWNF